MNLRHVLVGAALALVGAVSPALSDPIPAGWQASNIEPVGYTDLGGSRAGMKLALKQKDGRWYLFKGGDGFHVVDVTDPADPKVVKVVKGPPATSAHQITLHGDLLLLGLSRPFTAEETKGGETDWDRVQPGVPASRAYQEGVILYDVSDPANPKQLSRWSSGALGTHRNVYPGGKYAYLSATMPGSRALILVVLDVSDPRRPTEVMRWAYPNGDGKGEVGSIVPSFHGPAFVSPDGRMMTLGYTPSILNLDITDIRRPQVIGELKLIPPFADVGVQSIHTVVPLWDRKLLFFSGEPMRANCREPQVPIGFIDNSNPTAPVILSQFPTPQPPPGAAYSSFCEKPGRFGPHNTVTETHSADVMTPKERMYVTWFTAGLRAFNIRNANDVKEVGWFLPPDPPKPIVSHGNVIKSSATQDVIQDTRGYLYVTDSAWGVWILRAK